MTMLNISVKNQKVLLMIELFVCEFVFFTWFKHNYSEFIEFPPICATYMFSEKPNSEYNRIDYLVLNNCLNMTPEKYFVCLNKQFFWSLLH